MALVGFQARNHPQQVLFHGPRADVDERATPPELFAAFHRRFSFTVDAAALPCNAKLERYWTPEDDGLAQDWAGERVWCNPPFSNLRPWAKKAHESAAAELIVMLVPANRTEQGWWHDYIEPHRGRGRLQVEFLPGRIRFGFSSAPSVPDARPPFGCALLIWGES